MVSQPPVKPNHNGIIVVCGSPVTGSGWNSWQTYDGSIAIEWDAESPLLPEEQIYIVQLPENPLRNRHERRKANRRKGK